MRYQIFLNILDKIIAEAGSRYPKSYAPNETDPERINQSRARAYIHLYLKVSFGLGVFDERERFITDGSYDGGIDGYFINSENRTVYLIQSKFRTSATNFESKNIKLEEILVMDINRILEGETMDENGNEYNGKIRQLQRDISKTESIGRYKYQVVLLANLESELPSTKIRNLTGGYPLEVLNHEQCYKRLVFPVISGTHFNANDLSINIDLSNKSAGSKISYTVQTKYGDCEITVLFVPTLEVAKILHKYKNSILKFNPRSYLEFEGEKVNQAIRDTILNQSTNEFALFNNGITMLSDDTNINEKIGQKNKAQLTVKNPQIINGGQTAFTLSKIFAENLDNDFDSIFANKEVLLKVITLASTETSQSDNSNKLTLIDEISTATNQQTAVNTADKFSNDRFHLLLQDILFTRYGVLYERKRGEFGDGVNSGYISANSTLERNLFFRLYYAAKGNINKSIEKRLFQKQNLSQNLIDDLEGLDRFYFAFLVYNKLNKNSRYLIKRNRNIFGQIYVMTKKYKTKDISGYLDSIDSNLQSFQYEWEQFVQNVSLSKNKFNSTHIDKETNQVKSFFNITRWYKSGEFEKDLKEYFD
jgi:hypothetical protein